MAHQCLTILDVQYLIKLYKNSIYKANNHQYIVEFYLGKVNINTYI
jgi:hypothetical protein